MRIFLQKSPVHRSWWQSGSCFLIVMVFISYQIRETLSDGKFSDNKERARVLVSLQSYQILKLNSTTGALGFCCSCWKIGNFEDFTSKILPTILVFCSLKSKSWKNIELRNFKFVSRWLWNASTGSVASCMNLYFTVSQHWFTRTTILCGWFVFLESEIRYISSSSSL